MRVWVARSVRGMMRIVIVSVIASLATPPAAASDSTNGQRTPTLKESAARIAAPVASAAPAIPLRAREDRQGSASTGSKSFFTSRPGMIALAVMAVGTGYALYSAHHDRIQSAGKR